MMRQTGGFAVGEISTRSRFFSRAILSASKGGMIPICWPSSSITRISRARMRSFVRIKRLSIQSSGRLKRMGIITCEDPVSGSIVTSRSRFQVGGRIGSVNSGQCTKPFPAYQHPGRHGFHSRLYPVVGFVLSCKAKLEIVVGESLSVLAVEHIQRDRLNRFSHERSHEGKLLLPGELSQDSVPLSSDRYGNLVRHGGSRRPGSR